MKKYILMATASMLVQQLSAQFSSTAPGGSSPQYNNANVGIGTSSATSRLTIYDSGNSAAGQQIRLGSGSTTDYTFGRNPTTGFLDFAGSQTGFIGYTFSGGRVGIGTTSMQTQLDVRTAGTNDGVRITQTSNSAAHLGLFHSSTTEGRWALMGWGSANTQGANSFSIYSYDGTLGIPDRLFIKGYNGYVGIGTTNPQTKLSVETDQPNDGIRITQTGTQAGALHLYNTSSGGHNWALFSTGGANTQGAGNFSIYDYSTGADRFFIKGSTGYVGIGTINPTALLTVNGKALIGDPSTVTLPGTYNLYVQNGILTEKLRVSVVNSGTWADYVFNDEYKLRSLTEVEAFVKANNHLPEVPSAQEVEKNGVDMVDMDATLLKKIEELTLYIIEQNKRIEQLEKQQNNK